MNTNTPMTPKEFLSQAFRMDMRINSKLEQLSSLRALATKATATFSDVPPSMSRNLQSMEDTIIKILDMEREINRAIDILIDTKCQITCAIMRVENTEWQVLLELRYLCFKTWEQIAEIMGHDLRWIFRQHQKALEYISEKTFCGVSKDHCLSL